MAEPRVSVVVPVFDCEAYLSEALASVLGQTRAPNEVIVVDDGSSDSSRAVAASFAPDVRIESQPHRGAAAARNTGVAAADGDYLAFLDADDLWERDKLECQLGALNGRDAPELVFGYVRQFESAELAGRMGRHGWESEPQPGRSASTVLMRRASFELVGPFDPSWEVGEFMDWLLRAQEAGLRETMLDAVVLRRRIHTGNLPSARPRDLRDHARILKSALDRRRAMR